MSEKRLQNQNEEPENINEELLDDQYLEEGAELDPTEDLDEPAVADRYADVPSAADSPAEGVTGRWKGDGPTQVDEVLSRSGSIFGEVPAASRTMYSEKIGQEQRDSGLRLSEVTSAREAQAPEIPEREINITTVANKADKGLGKGNVAPKPEEDVEAAREEVEKSFKSEPEEAVTEKPAADKRAKASAKIGETAEAAAYPVKQHRSKQDRKTRGQDASRVATDKARAEGEAKRAAKAAEAPQTPPIMGEGGVKSEKKAKQTVVAEGTDGQQYITEPTAQPQERARVPKNAATEARQVPEAVIPTEPEAPAVPAEEPATVIEGTIVPGSGGSSTEAAEEFNSLITDSADFLGMDLGAEAPAPIEGPKPKASETAETQATQSREEQIDDDVLAAMGGADSGRPAKRRGGGRKARREEAAAEVSTPVEPIAEPESPRRPSPADMPGARKNGSGPSPANMPRRRPTTHAVNEQAPVAPEAEKSAAPEATPAEDNEWGTFAPEVEYGNENYKLAFGSTTFAASYRAEKEYQDAGKGENEDNLLVDQENGLIGVYDGMGSNTGKEARAASAAAAKAIKESWDTNIAQGDIDTVEDAVAVMRTAYGYARSEVQRSGEGTATAITAKVMEFDGERYLIYGHAGDARLVAYDPDTKAMIMGTKDQGFGHVIDNGLGKVTREWPRVEDEVGAVKLPKNARIMVCSDGITGDYDSDVLTNEDLVKIFQDNEDATSSELAHAFVAASRKMDDKTVVVMDVFAKEAAQTAGEASSDAPEYEEEEVSDEVKRILKKYENGLDVSSDVDESSEPLSDAEAELLKTAGERDTRTPEEVEADDAAEAEAKEAEKAAAIADDTMGSMRASVGNRLGGFGNRSRSLGSAALSGEDDSWADEVFGDLDDEESSGSSPWDVFNREPLDDPLSVTRRGSGETGSTDDHEDDDDENNDDDEPRGGSLDDLLGDFEEPEPARRPRRERVGAAFRTGWDKARAYFTGRDIDRSDPDIDGRVAKRQLGLVAGAVGATILTGALFGGLAGDTGNEGPTHVGKGPSASAEKTPGAKVDSGKTEAKPSESATDSDKKESKKPSATVDDDHRHEHGTGTPDASHTFDVGRETVKVSTDNEVVVTLKQGGTVWDALDKIGDELHINHSDEDIAETVQSMHLKPGQDRQMKVGSSYTFKVQGGKLVAKK